MDVVVSRSLLDRLRLIADASPSAEVCGLLTGADAGRIDDILPAANVATDPSRAFEVDPSTLFAAIRRARAGEAMLLGHYHSHPGGDATPSPRDAAAAGPEGTLWLILGREMRLWRTMPGGPMLGAFAPVRLLVADAIARNDGSGQKSVDLGQARG